MKLNEFIENRKNTTLNDFNDISVFFEVFFDEQRKAMSLDNPYDVELTSDLDKLHKSASAINNFLRPMDPNKFYPKQTEEKWKEIQNHAKTINTLLAQKNIVDLVDQHFTEHEDKSLDQFYKGIQKLNNLCGFELSFTDKQKREEAERAAQLAEQQRLEQERQEAERQRQAEQQRLEQERQAELERQRKIADAKKEKQSRHMFEEDDWADIDKTGKEIVHKFDEVGSDEQKEQYMNRLREMSPAALGLEKEKIESRIKSAEKIKENTDSILKKSDNYLNFFRNNTGIKYTQAKEYRDVCSALRNLKNITTKTVQNENGENVEKTVCKPKDVLKATQQALKAIDKYDDFISKSNKVTPQTMSDSKYADKVYNMWDFFHDAAHTLEDNIKGLNNDELGEKLANDNARLESINAVAEEKKLSAEELAAASRKHKLGEAEKSLNDTYTKAKATNEKVHDGSEQFDNALKSINEYSAELKKYSKLKEDGATDEQLSEAAKNMQDKAKETKGLINTYLERKRKELWNNANSKERIAFMNGAYDLINDANKAIGGDKAVVDERLEAKRIEQERIAAEQRRQAEERRRQEKEKFDKLSKEFGKTSGKLKTDALSDGFVKADKVQNELRHFKTDEQTGPDTQRIIKKHKLNEEKQNIIKRIDSYKAESEQHKVKRQEDAKTGDAKKFGTAGENAALVAADSIAALSKLSESKAPLTPEQKKEAVKHIARVFAYDNELFSPDKDTTKDEFKKNVRPLAQSKLFNERLGEITTTKLREFCADPKKTAEFTNTLYANNGKEQLRKETLDNAKKIKAAAANKGNIEQNRERFEMQRPKVSRKLEEVEVAPISNEAPASMKTSRAIKKQEIREKFEKYDMQRPRIKKEFEVVDPDAFEEEEIAPAKTEKQEVKQEKQEVKNEKQELKNENQELKQEKQEVKNENQELKQEKQELKQEKQELKQENQEVKQNEVKREVKKKRSKSVAAAPNEKPLSKAAAKRALKKKFDEYEMKRPDAPKLDDLYKPTTRKRANAIKKPKGMGM